jgi:hypothetical protein
VLIGDNHICRIIGGCYEKKISRFIDGKLEGKYILEIPASNENLSNIDYYKKIAAEYGVTLRFTEE